ncbi:hypothetical protein ACIQUF_25470 [Pseudomonas sp. NPDC090233]|uniref:hypothetical protein n=1 Tax=Pseudomonas sp. NPDC090233 TaxID=3364479 RepID=UPI00383B76B3
MSITQQNMIKIMDAQNECIGSVEIPVVTGNIISGTFRQTQYYKKYEKIFTELERAANELLIIQADQLEQQIHKLGFYAISSNNRKISIENLQIMQGKIVFTVTHPEGVESF